MPDGRTHFVAGVLAGCAAVLLVDAWRQDPQLTGMVAAGCGVGLFITPDADQESVLSFPEQLLARVPVMGDVWLACWLPYARLFKHRGVSHNLVFGTATRVIWLLGLSLFWLVVAAGGLALRHGDPTGWPAVLFDWWRRGLHPGLLLGWWWQDAVHIVLDEVT